MKSLAIEREYGARGGLIGAQIAKIRNIPFYDENGVIEEAIKQGHELTLLKNYNKNRKSILYSMAMNTKQQEDLEGKCGSKINDSSSLHGVISVWTRML